ncbi:MAG: heavy metal translocating P-type ATPase [Deltaproteobacteria bacterium]|jgi:Cu2+-exporting ATPase|nr:heavy metal translocating P-type ATPase [Deltaproteobacteria bacterium]
MHLPLGNIGTAFSGIDFQKYYYVAHKIPGRIRLRPTDRADGVSGADLAAFIHGLPGCVLVEVSASTGSVLITVTDAKRSVKQPADVEVKNPIPGKVMSYAFPVAVRSVTAVFKSIPYLARGLATLIRSRKLNLDVLDAAALMVCLLKRDFRSLSSIVFFFALGEFMADWTRKKSHGSLAESLALNIDEVWVLVNGAEILQPLRGIQLGQVVVVRAGHLIPVDGKVVGGEAMVNQSSMTGESMPVRRIPGDSVYAGTALEQGELRVEVTRVGSDTRIQSILRDIEESEAAKASIQGRYERAADAIVPYNFLLSGLVLAATGNANQAGSVLLVDYSCAIRLSTPLAILTALQEAAQHGVLIKGGKFAEALALADVLVVDKTGTLTEAAPRVVEVVPFVGLKRDYVLKVAACLEEHFPHPVGQAVVRAAEEENLSHREEHAKVELIVAHGIATNLYGKRVVLGSEHFVLEDCKVNISAEQCREVKKQAAKGRTVLYLAMDGELSGLIMVEDKIRHNAAEVIAALKADGMKRVIMLTGDNPMTAASIARKAGIDEFRAGLLPGDKAAMVAELRAQGNTVMMLGDGINDSSAISAANVGAAMCSGADMTKEVADVVLTHGDLSDLLIVRRICRRMLERVNRNFKISVIYNSLFLVGGILGFIPAAFSAFLHNATTSALAVRSMRPLLPAGSLALEAAPTPPAKRAKPAGRHKTTPAGLKPARKEKKS